MSEDKRYNGWANYETWLVNLWLGNDQGTDNYMRELAHDSRLESKHAWGVTNGIYGPKEAAPGILADKIKDYIEEENPLGDQASLFSDLINSAISEVDWYEIAEGYLEGEYEDNPEEEEEIED